MDSIISQNIIMNTLSTQKQENGITLFKGGFTILKRDSSFHDICWLENHSLADYISPNIPSWHDYKRGDLEVNL